MAENPETPSPVAPTSETAPTPPGKLCKGVVLIISLLLLAAAVGLGVRWMANRPRAERRRPPERIPSVTTMAAQRQDREVTLHAMGTVVPFESVHIAAQINGVATFVSSALLPGGRLSEGEEIVRIEPEDYELAVARAEADLESARLTVRRRRLAIEQARSSIAQAETNRQLERGRQRIAQREYEMVNEPIDEADRALVLRTPQLRAAELAYEAAVSAREEAEIAVEAALRTVATAESALRTSQLALERTSVYAPFNAVVQSKAVSSGAYVTPGAPIAALVNTDRYWVRVVVPTHQLRWIRTALDDADSATKVDLRDAGWPEDQVRQGRVLRVAPDLEERGRMAQLIVEVADPLCLRAENQGLPRLMLDSVVYATLHGESIANCLRIPRAALREKAAVWVRTDQNTLDIRPLEVLARLEDAVLADGPVDDGDRIVTSDLGTPVQDMKVQEVEQ